MPASKFAKRQRRKTAQRSREANTPYAQLWSIVDGAVNDAIKTHPDYLTNKGRWSARASIVKRVTGTVLSFATEQAAARGLVNSRADNEDRAALPAPQGMAPSTSSPSNPHCRIGKWRPKKRSRYRSADMFPLMTARLAAAVERAAAVRKGEGR